MRYPNYEPQVNLILDVARAARLLEKEFPDAPAADIIQALAGPATNWWWSLVDIIMDYEATAEETTEATAPEEPPT